MRKYLLLLLLIGLYSRASGFAQLTAPIDSGISIGHIHLFCNDPDTMKKIFVEAFGAQLTKTGTLELLRLPGVYIVINKAAPSAGSVGSSADHLGLSVRDLSDMRSKLATVNVEVQGTFAALPDGMRVELIENKAQTLPVVMHHFHLTAHNVEVLRQWYIKTFGATAGSRNNLPVALFNGNQVDFMPVATGAAAPAATKGRTIDHIGFEVQNLEVFVKKLQAQGVTIEVPYRDMPNLGLKVAFIVDPVGTRIELTQGLAGK